jgi:hypothetical protein
MFFLVDILQGKVQVVLQDGVEATFSLLTYVRHQGDVVGYLLNKTGSRQPCCIGTEHIGYETELCDIQNYHSGD